MKNRGNLPNFLVVGAPKCGTTSLFHCLRQHPDIFLPTTKELHYFSYEELVSNDNGPGDRAVFGSLCASEAQYESHYRGVRGEKAIGEISPSYLYYSMTAQRIRNKLGSVKIIVMLRNPIDKAFSQYMHLVRENRECESFYDAILAERHRIRNCWSDLWRYAESSLYSDRLQHFLDVFGADNVKVMFFEDFVLDTNRALCDLMQFIGVEELGVLENINKKYNRTGVPRSRLVASLVSEEKWIKSVIKTLLPESVRLKLRETIINLNTGDKLQMESGARQYLSVYFKEDVKRLADILHRDIPWTMS